ncbi:PadR family transcriptional regulator [Bacillus horti]|uniref:DNA-binding PadR family transcriptional regulator n=1 Tax=Caldalkalibacillus horti TaxID=77523 RepID=A0ABT9VU51_9BACI|nr:PadR family transcriptional regulator [Bacillus horti]MDQ0164513.1 DNA-binding PadR family transcriptional regulator [Bacillus horti]
MYEIFVLGQLMEEDKHGYLISERLKHAVGPIRKISSGTLYPLLSRLVNNGWVSLREEEHNGSRARKIYGLTEAGRNRFKEQMASPLEFNTDAELIFHFKMSYFHHVPKDVQLACLEQYLEYLTYNLKYVTSLSQMMSTKEMEESQRFHVLRMLDHRKHVLEADIGWVRSEIKQVEQQIDR